MAGNYFPRTEGEQVVWLNNFISKLATHLATLGLVAGDLTAITNDVNAFVYMVNWSATYKTRTQDVNDYKRQLLYGPGPIGAFPPGLTATVPPTAVAANVLLRLTALVNRIKAAPGYNSAIGEDLGIEGPVAPAIDLGTVKPTFTALAMPNSEVRLNWVKADFTGVVIEGRRNAEVAWERLGVDTSSPYLDSRDPLTGGIPESRFYRMRYLLGDDEVGLYSDVIEVSTLP